MDSNYVNDSSTGETDLVIPRLFRFWIFLFTNSLSLGCTFLHLYHLLGKNILRNTLSNHTIIVILFTSLGTQCIDVPFYMNYTLHGYVSPQTPFVCQLWWFVDVGTFQTTLILITWMSFERHILIFHEQYLRTRKNRWFFHYFPLIFFIIYPLLFYTLALTLVQCEDSNSYDYTQGWCGYSPCYYHVVFLSLWDIFFNGGIFTILAVFSDVVLIIRVIRKKSTLIRQPRQWRKHRKMIIQLLSISILCSIFSMMILIYFLLDTIGYLPSDIDPRILEYILLFDLYSILWMPILMLLTLPKQYWWKQWKNILCHRRQQRQVGVRTLTLPVTAKQITK
ncbi:unnamed protein product [Adineta ricciae]|uniref:G-protein coupled receptors family 1 profile domain-containing protein n=1 Tax=Adineta ricciae TaxID=249248 RepID=A0A815RUM9_ADIRI|nr:unnamed protein product [Adineta ricciae]